MNWLAGISICSPCPRTGPRCITTSWGCAWLCAVPSTPSELCPRHGRCSPTISESEDAQVQEPYRVMPTPPESRVLDFEHQPEPVPAPAQDESEASGFAEPPEVPQVSDDVARTARALAERVWSSGVQTSAGLVGHGIDPDRVEAWITHAVNMKWVTVDGDEITHGEVNPRLPDVVGDVSIDGGRGWNLGRW
jgi:hypothetical protein